MSETHPIPTFGDQLLQQEPALQPSQYQEHRMQLEQRLERARSLENRMKWTIVIALLLAMGLLPVSAGRVFGSPDPGDRNANWFSVSLGAIQVLSTIVFWVGLASYLVRIGPKVRRAAAQLQEQTLLEVLNEVRQLRQDVDLLKQARGEAR